MKEKPKMYKKKKWEKIGVEYTFRQLIIVLLWITQYALATTFQSAILFSTVLTFYFKA